MLLESQKNKGTLVVENLGKDSRTSTTVTPLARTGFRLRNAQYDMQMITKEDGTVRFPNVTAGMYTLEEVRPNYDAGYREVKGPWHVEVTGTGTNISYRFVDAKPEEAMTGTDKLTVYSYKEAVKSPTHDFYNWKNWIQFMKVNEDYQPLGGAEFTLRKVISENVFTDLQTTTSAQGTGRFRFEKLDPGTYKVFETKPVDGYGLPTGSVATFTVNEDNRISSLTIAFKPSNTTANIIENVKGAATFHIHKIGVDKTKAVGEAGYSVNLPNVRFSLSGEPEAGELEHIVTLPTNGEGIASFSGLPVPSYYYLKETQTPVGYNAIDHQYLVHVIPTDTTDSSALQARGYKVVIYEAPIEPIVEHYKDTDGLTKRTSDNKVIEPQNLLDYFTSEEIAKTHIVYTTPNDAQAKPFVVENIKKNAGTSGEVVINKIDEATGQPLAGAIFILRDKNKEQVFDTEVSNQFGRAIFDNLKYDASNQGIYFITELQAPFGYNVDRTEWQVTVTPQGVTTITAGDTIPNGHSTTAEDYSRSSNYEGIYTRQNFVVRSRIIDVDYVSGTYTQLIYANVNGIRIYNSGGNRDANPKLILTASGSGEQFNAGNTNYEVRVGRINELPNIETDGYETFGVVSNQTTTVYNPTYGTLEFDFGNEFTNSTGYAAIVKVTSKFDANSTNSLNVQSRLTATNKYLTGTWWYMAIVNNTVARPDGTIKQIDDLYDGDPNIFAMDLPNKKKVVGLGELTIEKTDGKKPLADAIFTIINKADSTKRRTGITGTDGKLTFPQLPTGNYRLLETEAPDGYRVSSDVWEVTVDTYGNTTVSLNGNTVSSTSENATTNIVGRLMARAFNFMARAATEPLATDGISITPVDGKTGDTLPEVTLKLSKISPTPENTERATQTGSNQVYNGLTPGIYVLETVGVVENYLPGRWTIEVSTDDYTGRMTYSVKDGEVSGKTNGQNLYVKLEKYIVQKAYTHIKNEKTKLTLSKVDAKDHSIKLADATFELWEGTTDEATAKAVDVQGNGIYANSDNKGIATFTGLSSKKIYWAKEIVSPTGYLGNRDKFYGPFVVNPDGTVKNSASTTAIQVAQPYVIENTRKYSLGKFNLIKEDENRNKLSGAVFGLYKSNDNWDEGAEIFDEVLGMGVDFSTNQNGLISFVGLAPGKYLVKEKTPPSGYVKTNDIWHIEVLEDGETLVTASTDPAENRSGARIASADAEMEIVSFEDNESTSSNSGAIARVSRTGEVEYTESTISPLPMPRAYALAAPLNDPLGLAQIYHDKPEPTKYKENQTDGTYPFPTSQSYDTVRNSEIPFDSLHWYTSRYKNPTIDDPERNLLAAGVNKYARATAVDGQFEINLRVQGNLVNPEERVDVMLLYDNSNSMAETTASGKVRFDVAKAATERFIRDVLSVENNPKGYIKMGLITYASDLMDGESHTIEGTSYNTPNYSYKGFTGDPEEIINKLPIATPQALGLSEYGGTFTSKALSEASKVLADKTLSAENHKRVVIHITDGVPTLSMKVTSLGDDGYGDAYSTTLGTGQNYNLGYREYYTMTYQVYSYRYQRYYTRTRTVTKNIAELYRQYYIDQVEFNDYYSGYNDPVIITSFNMTYAYQNTVDAHAPYTVEGKLINNHGFAAVSVANALKKADTEIYTLGIELENETFTNAEISPNTVTKEASTALMKEMSSGDDHYFDVIDVERLSKSLRDIFKKLPQRTVYRAAISDPMGDMVTIERDSLGDETAATTINRSSSSFVKDTDYWITASSDSLLDEDVKVQFDPVTQTISVEDFTLAEDDWINIRYYVRLNKNDPNYKEDYYYPTNKATTLTPNIDFPTVAWHFPRPSVRGELESIFVEKKWTDAFGTKITPEAGTAVFVYLESKIRRADGSETQWAVTKKANGVDDMLMRLDADVNWKGKFVDLLDTDTQGNKLIYRIVETPVNGYISNLVLKDHTGKLVDEIEGATGSAVITNTKLQSINVKKIWKNLDHPVALHIRLVAFKGNLDTPMTDSDWVMGGTVLAEFKNTMNQFLQEADGWKGTFSGLPILAKDGTRIIYRVVEINEQGEAGPIEDYELHEVYDANTNTSVLTNYKIRTLTIPNIPNTISFKKVNEEKTPINGATFQLKLKKNNAGVDTWENIGNEIVGTNASLFKFTTLIPGDYQLIELKAPKGYETPTDPVATFTVAEDGSITKPIFNGTELEYDDTDQSYLVVNKPGPMNIKLKKLNGKDRSLIVEGTLEFTLSADPNDPTTVMFPDGSNEIKLAFDLTKQSEVDFEGFDIAIPATLNGTYILKETLAPAGFMLGGESYYLKVNRINRTVILEKVLDRTGTSEMTYVGGRDLYKIGNAGTDDPIVVSLDVVNYKTSFPATGGLGDLPFIVFGIAMMAFAVFIQNKRSTIQN